MAEARRILRAGLGLLLAAATAAPALAQTGGMCGPRNEPVLVVLVETPQKVRAAADGISKAKVLVAESDTVIFADGRVVTSSLASTSHHLNALGWAQRPIEIAGAGTVSRAPTPRRRG